MEVHAGYDYTRKVKRATTFLGKKYIGIYRDFFEACCKRKSLESKHNFHENHGALI